MRPTINSLRPLMSQLSLASIPTPSLQQGINLYNAYIYFGTKEASILALTSLADGVHGISKNYCSLSAFWGYITYQAISHVKNSAIAYKYKLALYALYCTTAATGVLTRDADMFSKKHNIGDTIKYIALSAKLFDTDKYIEAIEQTFNESFINGIRSINPKSLLSNKFIKHALIKQVINIVFLFLTEKSSNLTMFYNVLQSKISQEDQNITLKYALKGGLFTLCNVLLSVIKQKIDSKLSENINKEINSKIADLVFNDDNKNTVMKLGDTVNNFSRDMDLVTRNANLQIEKLLHDLIAI